MNIKEVKKILGISNKEIAEYFGYKDANTYANSARKKNIEKGIVSLYKLFLSSQNNNPN